MNGIEIIKYLETFFPKELAYEWDNVGLQIGSLNKKVKKVLITLDVTKEVVKEAIEKKVDLILSHHPLIFKPVMNIQVETPRGWIIHHLISHNIPLYSLHTNYDLAEGGMNDEFVKALEIKNAKVLDDAENIGRYGDVTQRSMPDFIEFIKRVLHLDKVRVIGPMNKLIKVVGISGGSGASHMNQAKRKNCDVYLTGDIPYHTALDAIQVGITLIDIGHHAEEIFVYSLKSKLEFAFPEIEFNASLVNTDPFKTF